MTFTTRWQILLQDMLSPKLGSAARAGDVVVRSMRDLRREAAALGKMRLMATTEADLKRINAELRNTQNEMRRLSNLSSRGSIRAQLGQGLQQGISQIPGVGGFMAGAGSAGPIAAAAAAAGAVLTKAADSALDFNTQLGKINTTAMLAPRELRALGDEILALAAASTTPPVMAAQAYEKIISATGDARLSVDILRASLKGAEAGFTDINTVADAVTNTINSFGASKTNATQVLDVLLATKRAGKGEFNDIAANIATVAANAKNANASLFEMGGAFATLTSAGFGAEESAVRLSGIYREIVDPDTVVAFKALGIQIFDQQGKFRGLVPIAADMRQVLGGLNDQQRAAALSTLGLESRAAAGLNTLVESYDRFKGSVGEVANSQGEVNKALAAGATTSKEWQKMWSATSAELVKWGDVMLPLIDEIGLALKDLGPAIGFIVTGFRAVFRVVVDLGRAILAAASSFVKFSSGNFAGAAADARRIGAIASSFAEDMRDGGRFWTGTFNESNADYAAIADKRVKPGPGSAAATTPAATGATAAPPGGVAPTVPGARELTRSGGGARSGGVNMPLTINTAFHFHGGAEMSATKVKELFQRMITEAIRDTQVVLAQ